MLRTLAWLTQYFEELVRNKTFIETCNFLRSHAIRHDQQNKERTARKINATNQAHKKDKVKQVLALINELQMQDSNGSDEELEVPPSSKTAMVCKLAQIPPEIWMTLPLEAKKWLLNEQKRQQQEDDKQKKSTIQSVKIMISLNLQDKVVVIQVPIPICPTSMQG